MKIIVSNKKQVKDNFNIVDDPHYKHYKEILTELENTVKSIAEKENSILMTPSVGYNRSEDTGYLLFDIVDVQTVDNEMVLTYEQTSSVGAW